MDTYLCHTLPHMYLLHTREGCITKEYKLSKMSKNDEKLLPIYYNSF